MVLSFCFWDHISTSTGDSVNRSLVAQLSLLTYEVIDLRLAIIKRNHVRKTRSQTVVQSSLSFSLLFSMSFLCSIVILMIITLFCFLRVILLYTANYLRAIYSQKDGCTNGSVDVSLHWQYPYLPPTSAGRALRQVSRWRSHGLILYSGGGPKNV